MSNGLSILKRLSNRNTSDNKARIYLGNSFCRVEGFPETVLTEIERLLTYIDEEKEGEKKRLLIAMQMFSRKGLKRPFFAAKKRLQELGDSKVCLFKNNAFPSGLLSSVENLLKSLKIFYSKIDKRVKPEPYQTYRWQNRPPPLRAYQEEMIELANKYEKGVFVASVASGKTRVFMEIIKQKEVNTLIIVPSLALLQQWYDGLVIAFGSKNVSIIKSKSRKKSLSPIRLTNVQTLASLQKKDELQNYIKDIDMVLIDETHHTGAATFCNLLIDLEHVYYKYGGSGTFLRNDSKTMEMHGFLSNVLYTYTPIRALSEGYLTPVEYIVYNIPGYGNKDYRKEYESNYCNNKHFFDKIVEIVQSTKDKQVLILVARKDKLGKILHSYLQKKNIEVEYISGDNKKEDISRMIERFNNKEVKVLIGTGVIGEGVDVHSTQHLIIATGGKSEIQFVQAVGRCVRLHENKPVSYVHDFLFYNTFYMEKHLRTRLRIFESNFAGKIRTGK